MGPGAPPAGPAPAGPTPARATPSTSAGNAWTTVGRNPRPNGRGDLETWTPALEPQLWETCRASALVTDLEIRLAITGIPDFWSPVSVGNFLRSLGIIAACITAITLKRPANRPAMAFVNVTDQATADAILALSGTKQGRPGDPPILMALAHKPGHCSACGQPGHTQKKCVQCKLCRAWGHASILCPHAQPRRARSTSPPVDTVAPLGPSSVPTWHSRPLPPDVERALALLGHAAGPPLPPLAPPPAPVINFATATPTVPTTEWAPRPASPVPSPSLEWPRRFQPVSPASAVPGTPGPASRASGHASATAPWAGDLVQRSPGTLEGGPVASPFDAQRTLERSRLAAALRDNDNLLETAVEGSPEERTALLMAGRLLRSIQRHDAETAALARLSLFAPPPQIRQPE